VFYQLHFRFFLVCFQTFVSQPNRMSQLDREALCAAIQRRDGKVLKWYVEHATERGSAVMGPEDAEARMLYYQMRLQETQRETGSTIVNNQPQYRAAMKQTIPGAALHTPSLRQVAFPTSSAVCSRTASQVPDGAEPYQQAFTQRNLPYTHSHTTMIARPEASVNANAERSQQQPSLRDHHPVRVHHSFSRRLFRSYGSYIADEHPADASPPSQPTRHVDAAPPSGGDSSWTREWDAFGPIRLGGSAPPGVGIASPKADTSTFLLHQVGSVIASPRALTLHRKNFDLHEEEERVDIVQQQEYEWNLLTRLRHDDRTRTLGFTHRQQLARLETRESQERLEISAMHVDMTARLLHGLQHWQNGPAKAQNALLVNEAILRARLSAEEAHARVEMDTIQRKTAEHQLADLRRLKWLENEHRRATQMHQVLIAALSHQGVDVSLQAPAVAGGIDHPPSCPVQ
jgi:hypothetical protein